MKNATTPTSIERPPVVVVMGHIDHGKSTLLDFIRKSNSTAGEAGGITQHLSAYEVIQKHEGKDKKITFLDTPGHEAFTKMRERGAIAADIAILVVSAEDSVKAQTIEAWQTISESKLSLIVAINKIDKPGANIDKVKIDLAEKGIYLEGYGGDVPVVPISAKTGDGIPELLDTILLVAEVKELRADPTLPGVGVIIESHLDRKRGISSTLIIKNGTVTRGSFIVADKASAPVRIFEDYTGKSIDSATVSSPIAIAGFSELPPAGSVFATFATKKEADACVQDFCANNQKIVPDAYSVPVGTVTIPIIIKTDVQGASEAVVKELKKLELEEVKFKILDSTVGSIGENDIRLASSDPTTIILGFNTKLDPRARDLNEKTGVTIKLFDVIYHMNDFLKEEAEKRKPRKEVLSVTGRLKIIKCFSKTKEKQVVGGKVTEGKIVDGGTVRILRRDFEIGKGNIVGIEQGRAKVKEVIEGIECGILIESKVEISAGDILETFVTIYE